MNTEQNKQEEIQKSLNKGSNKAWLLGLLVLVGCVFLVGAILERLWRAPFGIGIMVVLLIVLVAYGFPSWFKTIKRNRQLERENKELLAKQSSS